MISVTAQVCPTKLTNHPALAKSETSEATRAWSMAAWPPQLTLVALASLTVQSWKSGGCFPALLSAQKRAFWLITFWSQYIRSYLEPPALSVVQSLGCRPLKCTFAAILCLRAHSGLPVIFGWFSAVCSEVWPLASRWPHSDSKKSPRWAPRFISDASKTSNHYLQTISLFQ